MRAPHRISHNNSDGMALIITLFVLAIITTLVVEFAYGVYVSTNALYNWQSSQRLSYVVKSAVRFASWIITENSIQSAYTYPGTIDIVRKKPVESFKGDLVIRIENENIKFNLNTLVFPNGAVNHIAYDSLVRMLKALSLDPAIADRIIDWTGPGSVQGIPGISSPGDKLKHASFDSADELLSVPGISREAYDKLVPYVTIYGTGAININGAGVPVLMSLSDAVDRDMAERLVQYRGNIPFEDVSDIVKVAGFETVGASLMGLITVKGDVFRVVATAADGGVRKIVESVLEVSGGNPVVIYWKEL
ncbi:MAG TPA: type II secretion system minor pseudopilin GspK [Dissulfurispiraceae bacterium]|nr:type II secretion system minor pseudopilin GspK [Dissulfurispiraceae bacterium]